MPALESKLNARSADFLANAEAMRARMRRLSAQEGRQPPQDEAEKPKKRRHDKRDRRDDGHDDGNRRERRRGRDRFTRRLIWIAIILALLIALVLLLAPRIDKAVETHAADGLFLLLRLR